MDGPGHRTRGPLGLALLVAAALVASAGVAESKPRFGLGLKLGAAAPVTAYLTDITVVLEDPETSERSAWIGDVQNGFGGQLTLLGTFRNIELGLAFYNLPWSQGALHYQGEGEVRNVNEFNVDDAGVDYRRLNKPRTVPASQTQVSTNSLSFSTIDIGYRYYLKEEGFLEAYVPAGGGIIWSGDPMQCELSFACGVHLFGGIAADLVIENLTFIFDVRAHTILTSNAIGAQEAADNAAVTGASVLQAFTSTQIFFTFDVGARWSIY